MAEKEPNTDVNAAATMWSRMGQAYFPCEEAVGKLKAGQYTIESSQSRGIYFSEIAVNTDELMVLPDTSSDKIIKQIEDFWTKKEKYSLFNFVWKRGFLLWGPPGSGKTTTIQLVAKNIIAKDGICVFVKNPTIAAAGLEVLRKIEPERPVVVILEDIDAITQRHSESELLALLDGELQIQNVVFLATTNYPEKLDKRLVNRPSRFDVVQKIDFPNEEARKMFLLRKNPRLGTEKISNANEADVTKITKLLEANHTTIMEIDKKLEEAANATNVSALEQVEAEDNVKQLNAQKDSLLVDRDKLNADMEKTKNETLAIDKWVAETDKFSIAHLKELILSVELFDVPFEVTVKRLRRMMDTKINHASDSSANI